MLSQCHPVAPQSRHRNRRPRGEEGGTCPQQLHVRVKGLSTRCLMQVPTAPPWRVGADYLESACCCSASARAWCGRVAFRLSLWPWRRCSWPKPRWSWTRWPHLPAILWATARHFLCLLPSGGWVPPAAPHGMRGGEHPLRATKF